MLIDVSNNRSEVQSFIANLEKELKKQFGGIKKEWSASLFMIAQNYQLYLDCLDEIQKQGLMVVGQHGELTKNPLFVPMFNAQSYLQKVLSQFGCDPFSKGKLKVTPQETENSFLDNM